MWGDGNSSNWSQLGQLDAKDWFVVGAGDYNGDQKDDLLVRQGSSPPPLWSPTCQWTLVS